MHKIDINLRRNEDKKLGRIKELLDKKSQGALTDEEAVELKELQAEAKAAVEAEKKAAEDEDKEIDEMANKFAETVLGKVSDKIDSIAKSLEKKEKAETKDVTGFIIDKNYGKKTVDELADIKINVPNRQDKQYQEISAKSLHFISALATGDKEKLQLLTEGTAANGGYLVPDDFANMIVEDIRDVTVMRNIADVMTTTSDTFHLPNLATRPKAAWRSEAAVKNTSTATFGENVFTPYSLAVIVGLSDELVADATLGVGGSIVNYISQLMAQSLAEAEDKAFFTGSGTGQPTGINQYTLGTVTAGGTDASKADAVISTFMRLPQGYRNRAVWVGNSSTIEAIQTLKDSNNNYLVSRLADSPVLTLKGRPVYEQNDIAGGTLYFGDFSYYKIVDREGVRVRVSDEATVASQSAFEQDLTYVRVEKRVDGELTLTQAIRVCNGI